jgi:serine/threonine-protein kinase
VSALNHPRIVTLYEIGRSDAGPFLVLERIEGRSLREPLNGGPLSVRRILTLAAQIAEGIARAPAAGISHRDLKPESVMVTGDGFTKVLDLGFDVVASARSRRRRCSSRTTVCSPAAPRPACSSARPRQPRVSPPRIPSARVRRARTSS